MIRSAACGGFFSERRRQRARKQSGGLAEGKFNHKNLKKIALIGKSCNNIAVNTNDKEIFDALARMHPDAQCELNFGTPFELLVAVILSAQCTDKRVNAVTKELFKKASTAEDFVAMPVEELEKEIYSCGFYHSKARAIKEMSASVVEMGGMPETREELMKLRGVGRKTANVVTAVAFNANAIAVDTHVFRVANRIGLAEASTPEETERQLMGRFDEELWNRLHHLLIFHGRYICKAQKPDCAGCELKTRCKYYENRQKV